MDDSSKAILIDGEVVSDDMIEAGRVVLWQSQAHHYGSNWDGPHSDIIREILQAILAARQTR